MAIKNEISYTSVDELMLDPLNPRLGRGNTGATVTQSTILSLMRDWTLDELAVSFLESGFWPQELSSSFARSFTARTSSSSSRAIAGLPPSSS